MISTDSHNPSIAIYDGFIFVTTNTTSSRVSLNLIRQNVRYTFRTDAGTNVVGNTACASINKNDEYYMEQVGTTSSNRTIISCWYKNRDYSGRN